jgi:histone acetyltransferase 1
LYKFIPADYTKSSATFEETVEADANTFKPLGEKLAAYVRPSGRLIQSLTGKGQGQSEGEGKDDSRAGGD